MRHTTHSMGSIRKGAEYVSNEVIKYTQDILGGYYIELLKHSNCGRIGRPDVARKGYGSENDIALKAVTIGQVGDISIFEY